jgi:hypothetical protein
MAKPHLIINIHVNNERQEGKTGPVLGWVQVEGKRVKGQGK